MSNEKEYIVEVTGEIFEELKRATLSSQIPRFYSQMANRIIKVIISLGEDVPFKIEIFSNEHPPPHVRITKDGASANYRISDGVRITPSRALKRCDRKVQKILQKHKPILIATWNERRPSDCPVGFYRE